MTLYCVAPSGIGPVDDVHLELARRGPPAMQAPQPAVVLVAHHDGRHRLGDVEGAVVERANLPVVAARVVHAADGAGGHEEPIDLLGDLFAGEHDARVGLLPAIAGGPGGPPRGDPPPPNWARTSASSRRLAGGSIVTPATAGAPTMTICPFTAARCARRTR